MSDLQPLASIATPTHARLDLDLIETDLADVEIALARLDSGEYWLDEVTGQPLDDQLLAQQPTARRGVGTAAAIVPVVEFVEVLEVLEVVEVVEVVEVSEASDAQDGSPNRDTGTW